jgi:hypothetical protein
MTIMVLHSHGYGVTQKGLWCYTMTIMFMQLTNYTHVTRGGGDSYAEDALVRVAARTEAHVWETWYNDNNKISEEQ